MGMKEKDLRILAMAQKQDGLIRRDQLKELGVSDSGISRRRLMGALVDVIAGVYRPGAISPTWMQFVRASVWWGGEGAALCGPTAAALYGLKGYETGGPVCLSVPGGPKVPRADFQLKLYSWRRLDRIEIRTIDGLPVVSPERTLFDLARELPPEQLERVIDDALIQKLTDGDRLRACFERLKGKNGSNVFGEILRRRGPTLVRVDSPLEADFLKLFASQGLRLPKAGPWVRLADQSFRLDFGYEAERLGIEIDSDEWHSWREQLANDGDRQNELVSWGWRILRFREPDLQRPKRVAGLIRRTLAQRSFIPMAA